MEGKTLSPLNVGLVFVGSMIGAGFASGKEAWQFFGVFGQKGLLGIFAACAAYCFLGYITVRIAQRLETSDMARIMCPVNTPFVQAFVGVVMCLFLLVAFVAMVAAGGALIEARTGIPHIYGSLVIMLLAVLTAIGGFSSVASKLGKVSPALVAATLLVGLYIVFKARLPFSAVTEQAASRFASSWFLAPIAYVGYNMTAAVPVLGQCAMHAKTKRSGLLGTIVGGCMLGLCCLILYFTTITDPALSAGANLPMLQFCELLNHTLANVYAFFLLLAIYGAASATFFGFTVKVAPFKGRTPAIWAVGILGYFLSLYGFSNFVANVYPIVGYTSLVFFVLEIVNYIKTSKAQVLTNSPK